MAFPSMPTEMCISRLHNSACDGSSTIGYYGIPDPDWDRDVKNERRAKLDQIAPQEKIKFTYEYDFGDDWLHDIVVEKILPPEEGTQYASKGNVRARRKIVAACGAMTASWKPFVIRIIQNTTTCRNGSAVTLIRKGLIWKVSTDNSLGCDEYACNKKLEAGEQGAAPDRSYVAFFYVAKIHAASLRVSRSVGGR